ncbi:SAV_2336 N-terminal domain-related protein [Sorangium sp. So ce134]
MIDRFAAILRQAGLNPTAREIADALWLAERMGSRPALRPLDAERSEARDETAARPREDALDAPAAAPSPVPATRDEPGAARAGVFPEGGSGAKAAGAAFRSATGTALPGSLALGRALRPLKRRVPSRVQVEMDDAATADRIAQGLRPSVVVRPTRTRWLDVALVIDGAASMTIWRRTVDDLRALLARHGAFRDVRAYQLATDEGREPRLFAGVPAGARRLASAQELCDPSGRRLVLVVSDCVASAWDDGRMGALLSVWGRHGPAAVLQVLPERLWQRSGLGAAERVRLAALAPGMRNTGLLIERLASDLALHEEPAEVIAVPVMELGAGPLAAWARMLACDRGGRAAGVLLPTTAARGDGAPLEGHPTAPAREPTAAERVARFRSMSKPEARKLATLFAAAPLSLPVMRLIREAMLPEATLGHLAEVFLGGLLREIVEDGHAVDPEYVRYDFFEGVRELLLDSASVGEAAAVLEHVSEYVTDHLGSSLDFRGWLADPGASGGGAAIAPADRPFAEIGAAVLRRLGGDYARLAERIAQQVIQRGPGETVSTFGSDPAANDALVLADAEPAPAPLDEAPATRRDPAPDARTEAPTLSKHAREYESVRRRMPSSPERTQRLDALVDSIARESRRWQLRADSLIERFSGGYEGDRVVVLAVLLGAPDPSCFDLVLLGITERRSRFEQYTALRVAREMVPRLSAAQQEALRRALEHERSGADGTWINESDASRWVLSGIILDTLGPKHVILLVDLASDNPMPSEPLLALLPPGTHVVLSLSQFGAVPEERGAGEGIDWRGCADAVVRMVQRARAEGHSRNTRYYVAGHARLPVFIHLGMELSTWARVTMLNQRHTGEWEVVALDRARQAERGSFFETIKGLKRGGRTRSRGRVAVFVSTSYPTPRDEIQAFIDAEGDVLAGVVEVTAAPEAARKLDAESAAQAADELFELFARIPSAYPNHQGLAVFVAGPASLALLVGRALDPSIFTDVWVPSWVPSFEGGVYRFALALPWKEGALTRKLQLAAIAPHPSRIFVIHAAGDRALAQRLRRHLGLSRRGDLLVTTVDDIPPGLSRWEALDQLVDEADLVVVLLSVDLLSSGLWDHTLTRIQERRPAPRLVPVLARSVSLRGTIFEGMQVLPRSGVAVAAHVLADEIWTEIARELGALLAATPPSPAEPAVPRRLLAAAEQGTLVPFAGAGVSMAVQRKDGGGPLFPSWAGVLEAAAARLAADGLDGDAASVRAAMLRRKKPSTLEAARIARDSLGPLWFELLRDAFDRPQSEALDASLDLPRALWQLGSQLVVTTSYDRALHWACPDRGNLRTWAIEAAAEQVDVLRGGGAFPTVWHLRGVITDATSLILTPDGHGYDRDDDPRAESRYQAARTALRTLLTARTFLFVGFSFDDESFARELAWVEETFQDAADPHYICVRESERDRLADRLYGLPLEPIVYADHGAPLLSLLRRIAGPRAAARR